MAITITKNTNGNVKFDDGTNSWSYTEAYRLNKTGDYVTIINELSGRIIQNLDYNNVTSVTDSAGGTVNITTVDLLFSELFEKVFFKTV